jgi:hypothetical protein
MSEVDAPADPVSTFASRLLDAPALRASAALQREVQVLGFLRANGPRMQSVFSSLGLDSSRGWQGPAAQIARAVRLETHTLALAEIADVVTSRLTLSFFPLLAGGRQPPARAREELRSVLVRELGHPVARSAVAGSLAAARADLIDKYIPQALDRKKYIFVEVTRVQRLGIGPAPLADLVRLAVLLRPAAYLSVTPGESVEKDAGFSPLQESFIQKILPGIGAQMPSYPPGLVTLGLRSTLAFSEGTNVEAVSRLAAVFSAWGRALSPGMVADRGADSPEKSWLNVNRRNARWRGLDPRMLDEMYTIAADNGW